MSEVLDLINQGRLALNLPILTKIPKGYRYSSRSCPVAKAFDGADVISGHIYAENYRDAVKLKRAWKTDKATFSTAVELPSTLINFVSDFDKGEYPDLCLKT